MSNLPKKAVKAKNPQLSETKVGVSSPERPERKIGETKSNPKTSDMVSLSPGAIKDLKSLIAELEKQNNNLHRLAELQEKHISNLQTELETLRTTYKNFQGAPPYFLSVPEETINRIKSGAHVPVHQLPLDVAFEYIRRLKLAAVEEIEDWISPLNFMEDLVEELQLLTQSEYFLRMEDSLRLNVCFKYTMLKEFLSSIEKSNCFISGINPKVFFNERVDAHMFHFKIDYDTANFRESQYKKHRGE